MIRARTSLLSNWRLILLLSVALSGCTAQRAYREGESLRQEGKSSEALKRYEEALRLEPDSARYRMAVVSTRAAISGQRNAETRPTQKTPGSATDAATEAGSKRRAESDSIRHHDWIKAAKSHLSKGETAKARSLLRDVLIEDPKNSEAQRLQQELEQGELEQQGSSQDRLSSAFQKPISIEFKDVSLKSIFEVFSRSSGINFLFDREVKLDQKITIFLRNTTVESAVKLTLGTNQLEHRILDANTVFVYPSTQAKIKEYQPLKVRVFYLANAEAKAVSASLKTILKTRDLVTDDKLNMLIIRDTPEAIRLAEKLIEAHDVAEPEVMLEVEVLEVNRKRVQELGIRWPEQLSLTPLGSQAENLTLADVWSATRDRTGRTIGASIGSTSINARVVDSDGEILANPRIRVRNRQKAKILIGDRVPNITSTSSATGFVAESITYVDVGLKLDVEPVVYVDSEVAINVALEVSTIVDQLKTPAGSIAYRIGTRSAQTVLRLNDGETQILAGLLSNEERTSGNRVPGLGELPVASRLFGSQLDDTNKTEIVLSITPRVLRNIRKPGVRSLEFDSGTEGMVGSAGLTLTSGPAAQTRRENNAGETGVPQTAPGTPRVREPVQPSKIQSGEPGTATSQRATTLRWQGPATGSKGDTMAIQLVMLSSDPVINLPITVAFDPKAIQVLSVTEGDFFKRGGQSSFSQRIDAAGQLEITSATSSSTGGNGPGVVATIAIRLLETAPEQTSLRILSTAPLGPQGQRIDLATPEPMLIRVDQ